MISDLVKYLSDCDVYIHRIIHLFIRINNFDPAALKRYCIYHWEASFDAMFNDTFGFYLLRD